MLGPKLLAYVGALLLASLILRAPISAKATTKDCSTLTATVQHGTHSDWVQIQNAILHNGKLIARLPRNVYIGTVRRMLATGTWPVGDVQLEYVDNTQPCLCDKSYIKTSSFWPRPCGDITDTQPSTH